MVLKRIKTRNVVIWFLTAYVLWRVYYVCLLIVNTIHINKIPAWKQFMFTNKITEAQDKECKANSYWMTRWMIPYRGLRSGCRQLKLTTGICRVAGCTWSLAGLTVLIGSRGERKGEHIGDLRPRPSLPRGGTLGRGEWSPSDPDPSSSSLIDGSFFMIPPLLS